MKKNNEKVVAILTTPGDKKDIARGINELLKDEKKRKRFGKRARKRAIEKFDWSVVSDKLLKKFQNLIENK